MDHLVSPTLTSPSDTFLAFGVGLVGLTNPFQPQVPTGNPKEIRVASLAPAFWFLTCHPYEIWLALRALANPTDTYLVSIEYMAVLTSSSQIIRYSLTIHEIYG